MKKSLSADKRILSVSIIAGPSASAFLERLSKMQGGLILPASAISDHGHGPDPAAMVKQIRAIAEEGANDHLIIECAPDIPVMAYASVFLPGEDTLYPLTEVARLATTALVITPSGLLDALVHRRVGANLPSPCLIAEQLEFVDNIVLDGPHDEPEFKRGQAIALTLNPRAQVFELSEESPKKLLADARTSFDFTAALDGAGWRKLIDAEERGYSRQDNVTAFAYRVAQPFHPERFWHLLQEELPAVFRAKGFFWLATRMELVGGLNLAGSELHCAPAGTWWAAREDHARELDMPERTRKEWHEPFGDRRQAMAFMGIDLDVKAFKAQLDACLLTDSEMSAREESWRNLTDPFPFWAGHSHEHECDHDHEAGDHECCHH
jgi:G3E family GTPase